MVAVASAVERSRALRARLASPRASAYMAPEQRATDAVALAAVASVGAVRPCVGCRVRGFALAGEFAYGCMRCEHTTVVLEVLGTPAPKGSSRAIMRGGFAALVPSGSDENRREQQAWVTCVRQAALAFLGRDRKEPLFVERPLELLVAFRMPRLGTHYSVKGGLKASAPAHPIRKPDFDKLLRATCDAMTGLVYDDDARIVRCVVDKLFAAPGHEGASITVRAM